MAVAYRSSSTSGANDSFTTSLSIPVPAGAAAGDIAIVGIEQWHESAAFQAPAPPAGFTSILVATSGNLRIELWWKRLTGADGGSYTFTTTNQRWMAGNCVLVMGGVSSGDPIEASNSASGTGTSIPTTSVTTATQAFLYHFVGNENSATQSTVPTSFTNVQNNNFAKSNYRIPGSTGVFSAANGVLSASTLKLAALVAVKPDVGATSEVTASIPLSLILSGTTGRSSSATAAIPLTLTVGATSARASEASASIPLTLAMSGTVARPAGPAEVIAEIPLTLAVSATSARASQVSASIPLSLALSVTTAAPAPPTYQVECPTVLEAPAFYGETTPWFMKAMKWPRTISLVKRNGVFVEQRFPTQDELIPLTEGVDYFIGGYEYKGISEEVANLLISSGFEESVTLEE